MHRICVCCLVMFLLTCSQHYEEGAHPPPKPPPQMPAEHPPVQGDVDTCTLVGVLKEFEISLIIPYIDILSREL